MAACHTVRRLELSLQSCCPECDIDPNYRSCSLSSLTQLQTLRVRNMFDGSQLDALKTHLLRSLQTIMLDSPQPFSRLGVMPRISTPCLELNYPSHYDSWQDTAETLADLVYVKERANRELALSFSSVRVSSWPADPMPAVFNARDEQRVTGWLTDTQKALSRLMKLGVHMELQPAGFEAFQLPIEAAADEVSSDEA